MKKSATRVQPPRYATQRIGLPPRLITRIILLLTVRTPLVPPASSCAQLPVVLSCSPLGGVRIQARASRRANARRQIDARECPNRARHSRPQDKRAERLSESRTGPWLGS